MSHSDSSRQVEANAGLIALAKETGVGLVATRNVLYLNPDDREGYEAQLCIQRGRTLEEFRRTNTDDVDFSFGTPEEILSFFATEPEALENTRRIAERIEFVLELGKNFLPIYPLPEGKTDNEVMRELCLAGLHERYGAELSQEITERFDFEYATIVKMGFSSYFLIVQDYINWAKDNGVLVGPGRGSAAGSIVAYALRITDIDPLCYGLLFERFLNPDRLSMPDIDTDFADSGRGKVLQYITQKYGADHVAGIITYGTMMPRAAVRDAARVLGLSFQEGDRIAKVIPPPEQGKHMPLAVALQEAPDLKMMVQSDPIAARVIEIAMKIEGNPRHASQHACGIVIGDRPLVERVPLQAGQKDDMAMVTQYSLNAAEAVGLVKMDFLGLSNLSIIEDTLKIIQAVHGVEINIDTLPLDDQEAFALMGRGDTVGVFQLECLSGDTIVSNTTLKKLYERQDKKTLEAVYLDDGKVHKNVIEGVFKSGVKKVYNVIADNGWFVKATLDHSFLTYDGWKKLRDIKLGEKILMKQRAKHLVYNECQSCKKQIDGQKDGWSSFCYSCSARHYSNPSKSISRESISRAQKIFYQNGGRPWNDGLSIDNSQKMRETGKKISAALDGRTWEDLHGIEKTKELRERSSRRMSGPGNHMFGQPSPHRNGGFREDLGHYVRSSWEADFARVLKLHKLDYLYEPLRFTLVRKDGDILHYTPDFYVPEKDTYYEIKGWMHDSDVEKIALFKEQYPENNFVLIDKTKFAEFAVAYKKIVAWECPKIPRGFIFVTLKEVKYKGEEETYDIKMRAPGNNFVANGFVVHNSDGMQRHIKDLQPTRFEDIIAMVSLYRPGPMQFIESFIRRKHGLEQVAYEHPLMENAFKETYGIPVYQEQVMQVSKDLAGFTAGEADGLRKAMGKKLAELMAKMKVKFIEGAVKKGVKGDVATKIFQKLEDFAAYGFNKSHAACYALIAYRTAYLKAYYPECFMAALMNADSRNIDRIRIEVEECTRMGLSVLAPDVNESFAGFAVVKGTKNIRWGLMAIKNVGTEIAESLVRERKEHGEYVDLADFLRRIHSQAFNKKTVEALVKSGALDRFGDRATLLYNLDTLVEFNKQVAQETSRNQSSLFDMSGGLGESSLTLRAAPSMAKSALLAFEKELLGLYVSEHPAQLFAAAFAQAGVMGLADVQRAEDGNVVTVAGVLVAHKQIYTKKKNEPMSFTKIEDTSGSIEAVLFPKIYATCKTLLEEGVFLLITGKVSVRRKTMQEAEDDVVEDVEERSLLVDQVQAFTEAEIEAVARSMGGGMVIAAVPIQRQTDPLQLPLRKGEGARLTVAFAEVPAEALVQSVRGVLQQYVGEVPVFIEITVGGVCKTIATEYKVGPSVVLVKSLEALLGEGTVSVV